MVNLANISLIVKLKKICQISNNKNECKHVTRSSFIGLIAAILKSLDIDIEHCQDQITIWVKAQFDFDLVIKAINRPMRELQRTAELSVYHAHIIKFDLCWIKLALFLRRHFVPVLSPP